MKLRIEKAIYGGAGLARIEEAGADEAHAGKTAFVPLTLPGELVEADVTEDKHSFVNAEVNAVLNPSLLRTVPLCPYFGTCGGCSYQHAAYPHQLEMKAAILRETLERARVPTLPEIQIVSGEPWGYRNRVRLRVQPAPFALCYRERRSNRLLAVSECPITAPLLENAIATVTDVGASLDLAQFCEEIEFFSNAEDSLLVSFFCEKQRRADPARLSAICNALKQELPQLRGAGLFAAQGKRPPTFIQGWGDPSLLYPAAGFVYRVGVGSFFQVNRFLVDGLVDLVAKGRTGRVAWDLYAGVGLFARALTAGFERVIAVESSPSSSTDLRRNLAGTSHRAIEAATSDFLEKHKASSTPPDLVVLDPPRAGLGAAITGALSRIRPARIVYVSCDPATLSRDLAALLQSGYDLRTITMVDMFPQTFHLESVSVLERIS
jgi:23S rRNA (uracil1939-C5)-methyltransferase